MGKDNSLNCFFLIIESDKNAAFKTSCSRDHIMCQVTSKLTKNAEMEN